LAKAACQNETISNGCESSVCIKIEVFPSASIFKTSRWTSHLKIDYVEGAGSLQREAPIFRRRQKTASLTVLLSTSADLKNQAPPGRGIGV
jgi:hypothetical protein